jgi:hypothetical protein
VQVGQEHGYRLSADVWNDQSRTEIKRPPREQAAIGLKLALVLSVVDLRALKFPPRAAHLPSRRVALLHEQRLLAFANIALSQVDPRVLR